LIVSEGYAGAWPDVLLYYSKPSFFNSLLILLDSSRLVIIPVRIVARMRIGKIPGINPVVIPITKDTITTSKKQALKIPINPKVTTSGLMTHGGAGRDKPCPYGSIPRAQGDGL
jgi:hypothetical protein